MFRLYLGIIALTFITHTAFANDRKIRLSQNMDDLDFYVHVTDIGRSFSETYGHIQIRIVDETQGGDYLISWGLFDYRAPNFGLNFYKGRLSYKVGIFETRRGMATYRYDRRTVWQERLNFTYNQKKRFLEKTYENLKPENRSYLYNYFWDNCSTRPRDFIDHALNGAFKKMYTGRDSERTWRQTVRWHQSLIPLSGLFLEVLMNSNLDVLMTRWQEMYLPEILRQALLTMPQFDDVGQPVEGTKLLTESTVFYKGDIYERTYTRDYWLFYLIFALPLIVIFLIRRGGKTKLALRLLGAYAFLWFLLAGFLGALMPTSWVFSNHSDLKHNANMLLFWPVDWWFCIPAFLVMIGKIPSRENFPKVFSVTKWLLIGHVVLFVFLSLLQISSLIAQNVGVVLGTFGVVSLAMWVMMYVNMIEATKGSSAP